MNSKIKLNNGIECPLIGLGTWKSDPGDVLRAVKTAIDIGFRHIDCAPVYENEKEIGAAIDSKINEGVVRRQDLFITSKLWNTHHDPKCVERALIKSMKDLQVDYLDLYLIHWPCGFVESDEYFPQNQDGTCAYSDVDYVDTWLAMEKIYRKGLVKAIGVSNFNIYQLERVLEHGSIVPAMIQIESSPYLNQSKLICYCESKGIRLTAYSPLGSPDRLNCKQEDPNIFEDPLLKDLSKKYDKSVAQIALKFQVQRSIVAIPKSISEIRLKENLSVFDFVLCDEDMAALGKLDRNYRTVIATRSLKHKFHPFVNDFN